MLPFARRSCLFLPMLLGALGARPALAATATRADAVPAKGRALGIPGYQALRTQARKAGNAAVAEWFENDAITSTSQVPYPAHYGRVWDAMNDARASSWEPKRAPGRADASKLRNFVAVLNQTREGREAVATMKKYGVKVRFLDGIGGLSYQPRWNAVVVGGQYGWTSAAPMIVHEMVHAKDMNTGKLPIPTEMTRGRYVRASLAAEARATSKEAELLMRNTAWHEHGRYSTPVVAYREAYAQVIADARAESAAAAKAKAPEKPARRGGKRPDS